MNDKIKMAEHPILQFSNCLCHSRFYCLYNAVKRLKQLNGYITQQRQIWLGAQLAEVSLAPRQI